MVLMHLLHRTQRIHQAQLEVCTIDHQLRSESKEECARVMREAQQLGISAYTKTLHIDPGGNTYERARIARQEVLLSAGCERIATGHHQQDQAETLLYRLLRGSGIQGLSGMRALSVPWCRPLLFASRKQIYNFAQREEIWWVEDPSNACSLRGMIREMLPHLDSIHGPSVPVLARTAELLALDADLLEQYTQEAWNRSHVGGALRREIWEQEEEGMKFRLLRKLFLEHCVPIRYNIISAFVAQPAKTQIPKGGWLCIDREKIWVAPHAFETDGD